MTYKCLCEDGSTPDLAKYKDTLPDFVCQADFAGCIKAHPNDAVGQGKCKTDIQDTCGTLNITDYVKGSGSGSGASSSGSASETTAPSSTGAAAGASETKGGSTPSSTTGSGAAAATSKAAAVALTSGMDIGAGVLAAGLLGIFGYML